MRTPTIVCLATTTTLLGCLQPGPVESPPPTTNYEELGAPQLSLSGVVYDPEAFFVSMASWPPPEEEMPPPLLFEGFPFTLNSAVPGVTVALVQGDKEIMTSEPSDPMGAWNAAGVVPAGASEYQLVTHPPKGPVTLGAGYPPPFTTFPEAKYYPTRALTPVVPRLTYCMNQAAITVGNTGALQAIADARTAGGVTTTVDHLLDPKKTGGVLLVWTMWMSDFLTFVVAPANQTKFSADRGEIYAIEWAPPDSFPGQTPMGFFAFPGDQSGTGYFAVVLPPGATGQVHMTISDTVENAEQMRPFEYPDLTWDPTPGVTVARAYPTLPFGPDPDADPVPTATYDWNCDPR